MPEYVEPLQLFEGPPSMNEVENAGNNDGDIVGVGSNDNDNLDDGIGTELMRTLVKGIVSKVVIMRKGRVVRMNLIMRGMM